MVARSATTAGPARGSGVSFAARDGLIAFVATLAGIAIGLGAYHYAIMDSSGRGGILAASHLAAATVAATAAAAAAPAPSPCPQPEQQMQRDCPQPKQQTQRDCPPPAPGAPPPFVPDGYELPEVCKRHGELYVGIFDDLRPWFERGITKKDIDACGAPVAPPNYNITNG